MQEWITPFSEWLNPERLLTIVRAAIFIGVGMILARIAATLAHKAAGAQLDAQGAMLVRRFAYYLVLGLFLVSALHELGFSLGVLLGAAGVLSVALGFASQTSASNLISGLFLLGERPFAVGDVIQIGATTGEVMSIDLLSVKLRTFDNRFVRIPNESMIKSEVITLTRFPIRRYDIQVGIAYREDISRAREVLIAVADKNPLCLEEPKPLFIFLGFGDSALNFQFSVWASQENFLEVRNSIQEQIKLAFDEAGIEIPFPHRTLYAGSVTEPFPVRVVADLDAASASVSEATSGKPE